MLPDLREIKAKRVSEGLTQSQLAQQSGVSQSLIAKVETLLKPASRRQGKTG